MHNDHRNSPTDWVTVAEHYVTDAERSGTKCPVGATARPGHHHRRPCPGRTHQPRLRPGSPALRAAARAHAKAGRLAAARTELGQAGQILAKTAPDSGFFGFPERELLMYQSGVLTSIGDPAAFDAQTAALDSYPADDPMDRPLIRLDRARHLATQARDPHAAAQTAITAITDLPAPLRVPLLITQAKTLTP